jgi:predicted nucleic acid-binding protein
MPAEVFFDTSILLYMVTSEDPRTEVAEKLLRIGGVISVQVLNEFVSVARRKYTMDWKEIEAAISGIRLLCNPVVPLTINTHETGIHIAQRYKYRIYDALHLAAAIESGCTTLYSEDMQDGQTIGSVTIRNPFAVV